MTDPNQTRHTDPTTPPTGVVLPGPWTPEVPTGTDPTTRDRDTAAPPAAELDDDAAPGEVLEGDVLGSAGMEVYRPRAVAVSRDVASRTWIVVTGVRTVATHPQTRTGAKLVARNLWYPVAGAGVAYGRWRDTHGASRYERQMRRAEIAGDQESLREWEARDVAEKQRRHDRVMDWVRSPVDLLRAAAAGLAGFAALLLVLGVVLALGHHDPGYVLAPIVGVIALVTFVCWFLAAYGALLLLAATGGVGAWLWHLGRSRSELPAWVSATTPDGGGGRDVIPDERAITNALRNLNLPALNKKFREGWTPRWLDAPAHDGKGWHSRLLLPEGVTVEMIVNSKRVLAHNLLRLPVEVWPTEPRDKPGVLDLWVADQGSLTKPVAPWPLLTTGTADYFKGVPVGVDPRGNVVLGRLFQANWGVAGMMGSGKSTLIITALLGAILDPLVEIDVYCMAVNADYDPLRPRLRTLFVSDDPDEIPTVLAALKQLMSELSDRGRKLSAAGEPKLTRRLAEADPSMRPRVVVIDECQELFVSDVGEEAAELVEKIVAKARKYGVTLIFATPVPSADSLPRKVAKVLSNRACFAIGDHQGNDAILGTGKHRAGISATTLRPMTVEADGTVDLGDLGTAMTSGFTPADGLLRCFYVRRGDGIDDVTPVVERALAMVDNPPAPADDGPEQVEHVDPLADIVAVIRAAGPDPIMPTLEVLAGLAALRPQLYRGWTFERLREELPDSARPYKTRGRMSVNAERVAAAMADRDTDPADETADEFDTA
ncbi:zonular occludens toxin domain-containing protein [Pseudofrankia inefficax]|uniref:Cell division protein FtsK/SpoIIIE n=1 Tax=Pseudofrankia inefficax (strain DSM 45817 / CECT 9037 / DDB 130130 / EuI1c) TaxID=298654 RepID=E3JDQ7_PSEI1|nr:zonular occludens toxin domain-containing protein [Pseudofrankia inefficax]ADP84823.1 cell division protein FtsK/SpoIIIE [Pseudofrankia inefficax]